LLLALVRCFEAWRNGVAKMTELPPVEWHLGKARLDVDQVVEEMRQRAENRGLEWLTQMVMYGDAQRMLKQVRHHVAERQTRMEKLRRQRADLQDQFRENEDAREDLLAELSRNNQDQIDIKQEVEQYQALAERLEEVALPTLDEIPALRDLLGGDVGS
jgi:predicted nuclease with TOPRIM domain